MDQCKLSACLSPSATRPPAAMGLPAHCTVGPGWFPLLHRLDRQLGSVTADFTYVRIYRDRGMLRCRVEYGSSVDPFTRGVCERLIDASVEEALTTCELCGRRGGLKERSSQPKVLCDGCFHTFEFEGDQ